MTRSRTITGLAGLAALAAAAVLGAVAQQAQPAPVELSNAERAFVAQHPVIRVGGAPDWAPIDFVDEQGRRSGITPEILRLLAPRLGLAFEWVERPTWTEIQEAATRGEVDVLSSIGITEGRAQFLLFTRPYLRFRSVIVVRDDAAPARDMADFREARFALARGYAETATFREQYPDYDHALYPAVGDALGAVASGTADAAIGNVAVVTYWIRSRGLTNLRVAAPFLDEDRPMYLGVRKDWPELLGILERGLSSLSDEEMNRIQASWMKLQAPGIDPAQFWWGILWASVALLLIGLGLWLWTRAMRREVTLRRESEARIEAAQKLLREVTDGIPEGVVFQTTRRADGSFHANFISNGIFDLIGVTRTDAVRDYKLVLARVIEADQLRLLDVVQASAETMTPYEVEYRAYGPDGAVQWLRSSAVPHPGPGGSVLWNGFTTQINELKKVEGEIRAAQNLLQEITDGIPGAVYRFHMNRAGRIALLFASSGLYELLGRELTEKKILFETVLMHVIGEERQAVMQEILDSARTLAPIRRDVRIARPDGDVRWLHAAAVPHRMEDGTVVWNGYAVDVTERKHLERDLARAREQVVDMARGLPGVVYQSALRADGTVEVLFNHDACYELLGLPADSPERIGYAELMEAVLEDDRAVLINAIMRSATELTPIAADFRLVDGRRWVRIEGLPKRSSEPDVICLWNAYGLDITERKQLERDFAAAKEAAEAASRAKGEFLANMSHEIRTPMNAIIGLSHLALRANPDPRLRDYVEKIQSAAQSLLGIINDILDFSKIEAGKLGLEATPFQLDDVLSGLSNIVSLKAAEKGLEFLFNVPLETPHHLVGDPLRLGQVLLNVASNAVKFTDQGQVIVSVREVRRDEHRTWLDFAVTDSGIGMSAEQVASLFHEFSQADGSITRRYGGTGLGLSISKRLVEMMGGEIEVESAPGQGSTFRFSVPLGLAEDTAAGRIDLRADAAVVGSSVLVVDDNAASREILVMYLRSFGFEASALPAARAAIDLIATLDAEGEPIRLVLMDWQMPEMSGVEAARHIREMNLTRPPPAIVMVSAYGREELVRLVEAHKLDGLLLKPVSPSILLDTVVQTLGGTSAVRAAPRSLGVGLKAGSLVGIRTLIVEDNRINQQVVGELLEQAGATVVIAEHGEALERLAARAADLVLMDLQMPVMDGIECTRRIRAGGWTMPVIAMTASAMPGDKERCLASGMNDYLSKPVDVARLSATLVKWLGLGPDALEEGGGNQPLTEPLPEFDRSAVTALMARLRQQLAAHDSAAADTLDALRGAFGATPPPRVVRELGQLVDGFSFDAARRKLDAVARQLGLGVAEGVAA